VNELTKNPRFGAVVLAGERPGGGALARELGLAAGVLAPVAGRAAVARVVDALRASRGVGPIVLCGPAAEVIDENPALRALLTDKRVSWRAPETGPGASALAALAALGHWPALVTSGDHALLEPEIIDDFCAAAAAAAADAVVGLVPWSAVRNAFPESRRTVLKFADEPSCGSNLFAVMNRDGLAAIRFWRRVEALRKRPWRIARRLGWWPLLRYLSGRLSRDQAAKVLSERAGCRVRWVGVTAARAAVDVDTMADLRLAEELLGGARRAD